MNPFPFLCRSVSKARFEYRPKNRCGIIMFKKSTYIFLTAKSLKGTILNLTLYLSITYRVIALKATLQAILLNETTLRQCQATARDDLILRENTSEQSNQMRGLRPILSI